MGAIVGLVIGIGFIGLALYTKIFNGSMLAGEQVRAEVVGCERDYKNILGTRIPCYKVDICIFSQNGRVTKSLSNESYMETGTLIDVYYNEKSGKFQRVELINANSAFGSTMLLIVGIIWCAIMVGVMWANHSDEASDLFALTMAYVISGTFIILGFWLGIVQPIQRKKTVGDCHTVTGRITDFVEERDEDNDIVTYPIYTYEKYGEPVSFRSNVGGNLKKYRKIGRKVQIVINDASGEVYAKEDDNTIKRSARMFLVLGIIMAAAFTYLNVTGQFATIQENTGKKAEPGVIVSEETASNSTSNIRFGTKQFPEDAEYIEYSYNPRGNGKVYSYTVRIYGGDGQVQLFPHQAQGKSFHQTILFDLSNEENKDDSLVTDASKASSYIGTLSKSELEVFSGDVAKDDAIRYIYRFANGKLAEVGHSTYGEAVADNLEFYITEKSIKDTIPDDVWDTMENEMKQYYK